MENVTRDLASALRERLALIRDEESRHDQAKHIERLREISEKIDKLQAALPQPVDPRLAHYLQRKSYNKALDYLEGRDDRRQSTTGDSVNRPTWNRARR
jgi:hypothetical protein